MIFNSAFEKRFGLRCHFKGGGGGLTGATSNSETANEQQVSASNGAVALHTGAISGGVTITNADAGVAEAAINTSASLASNVVGQVTNLATTYGEGQVEENLAATSLVDKISGILGNITSNAAPQTGAAESEILSGSSPLAATNQNGGVVTSGLANGNNIIWIVVGLAALAFYAAKGNGTK